jgi:hypothetical protein
MGNMKMYSENIISDKQCIFKASILREQSTQMNDTSKHTLILYCFTDSHIYFKLNHTHICG